MLGQLNENQVKTILTSQVLGRLACTDGKQPYIVPVTYAYDGEYIYGQTNAGKKLDMLRANPFVCFETDVIIDMRNWQSVIVYGTFEELYGAEADKARNTLLSRVFPLTTSSTVYSFGHQADEEEILDDTTRMKDLMYRIRIRRFTGRFEKQG